MIAIDLADLIGAEQTGRYVWTAECPICGFRLLKILGSRFMVALLRCDGGCSIYRIAPALRLSFDDLASRPRTAPPDFANMDDFERRASDAADRQRQARHKVASEQFRVCWRNVVRVKRKIKAETTSYVPLSLALELEEAGEALTRARRKEKRLRG
jgi:hypothetical protein